MKKVLMAIGLAFVFIVLWNGINWGIKDLVSDGFFRSYLSFWIAAATTFLSVVAAIAEDIL